MESLFLNHPECRRECPAYRLFVSLARDCIRDDLVSRGRDGFSYLDPLKSLRSLFCAVRSEGRVLESFDPRIKVLIDQESYFPQQLYHLRTVISRMSVAAEKENDDEDEDKTMSPSAPTPCILDRRVTNGEAHFKMHAAAAEWKCLQHLAPKVVERVEVFESRRARRIVDGKLADDGHVWLQIRWEGTECETWLRLCDVPNATELVAKWMEMAHPISSHLKTALVVTDDQGYRLHAKRKRPEQLTRPPNRRRRADDDVGRGWDEEGMITAIDADAVCERTRGWVVALSLYAGNGTRFVSMDEARALFRRLNRVHVPNPHEHKAFEDAIHEATSGGVNPRELNFILLCFKTRFSQLLQQRCSGFIVMLKRDAAEGTIVSCPRFMHHQLREFEEFLEIQLRLEMKRLAKGGLEMEEPSPNKRQRHELGEPLLMEAQVWANVEGFFQARSAPRRMAALLLSLRRQKVHLPRDVLRIVYAHLCHQPGVEWGLWMLRVDPSFSSWMTVAMVDALCHAVAEEGCTRLTDVVSRVVDNALPGDRMQMRQRAYERLVRGEGVWEGNSVVNGFLAAEHLRVSALSADMEVIRWLKSSTGPPWTAAFLCSLGGTFMEPAVFQQWCPSLDLLWDRPTGTGRTLFRMLEEDQSGLVEQVLQRQLAGLSARRMSNCLDYCVLRGLARSAGLLIRMGADVNATSSMLETPLGVACREDRVEMVRLLLEAGARVDGCDVEGRTALWMASAYGRIDVVKLLVDQGADLDAVLGDKTTVLMGASVNGNVEVVRLLLARGARFSSPGEAGMLLRNASRDGDLETMRTMLDRGADVNAPAAGNETTPLYLASENGHWEAAKLLIGRGANVNATDHNGRTPLHRASKGGYLALVRLLIGQGADVTALDCHAETPLQTAKRRGHWNVVKVLLESGG